MMGNKIRCFSPLPDRAPRKRGEAHAQADEGGCPLRGRMHESRVYILWCWIDMRGDGFIADSSAYGRVLGVCKRVVHKLA